MTGEIFDSIDSNVIPNVTERFKGNSLNLFTSFTLGLTISECLDYLLH